jgi:N-acetylglucosamine-6-phosphate deacetylase
VKLRARHFRTGATKTFVVEGATVTGDLVFGPGFFDLQCNGFAGVDFNHPGTTAEQVATAIGALRRHGCTQVLPTVITHSPERLEHLLRTLVAARRLDPRVRRAVPGFHLEGPFLSAEEGARGAHPREHIRSVERTLWRRLQRAAEGGIRLVTLAPEVRGAIAFIRQLRAEGVRVAVGHTLATREQIAIAVEAGAQLATHLGNGCPQQLHRHRNPIFAQLGDDRLAASVIADGVHLPAELLRIFFRAKGAERTILVSDAMAAAGSAPGRYTLGDLTLAVGRDRVVRQPGQPNFAGSALTMNEAVANLMEYAGATLAQSWTAAAANPRKLLGIASTREVIVAAPGGGRLEIVAAVVF